MHILNFTGLQLVPTWDCWYATSSHLELLFEFKTRVLRGQNLFSGSLWENWQSAATGQLTLGFDNLKPLVPSQLPKDVKFNGSCSPICICLRSFAFSSK